MEIVDEVKRELVELVKSKYNGDTDLDKIVEFLWETGMLDKKTALRYCIREKYHKTLKHMDGKSCFDVQNDIAEEFDVDVDFVKNAIYKYTHLTI